MKNVRYWVEYNFVDTKWGRRPMNIKVCDTDAEAEEFAKTVEDAEIVPTWEVE